jgi:hypothetical protein
MADPASGPAAPDPPLPPALRAAARARGVTGLDHLAALVDGEVTALLTRLEALAAVRLGAADRLAAARAALQPADVLPALQELRASAAGIEAALAELDPLVILRQEIAAYRTRLDRAAS